MRQMPKTLSLKNPDRRESASRYGQWSDKWPPEGREPHKPVWVNVNAQVDGGWIKDNVQVDEGIAELVTALNAVEGLETIESCQGWSGGNWAAVYFYYGDWKKIRRFLFKEISLALKNIEHKSVTAEIWGRSDPMGTVAMAAEVLPDVTAALKLMIGCRNNKSSRGTKHKTLELPF